MLATFFATLLTASNPHPIPDCVQYSGNWTNAPKQSCVIASGYGGGYTPPEPVKHHCAPKA